MSYKLTFSKDREIFIVEIIGKEIFYKDRKMVRKTRMIPVDERITLKVNRNIVPQWAVDQFKLTNDELREYQSCNNEEELKRLCIKDCLSQGCILIKEDTL